MKFHWLYAVTLNGQQAVPGQTIGTLVFILKKHGEIWTHFKKVFCKGLTNLWHAAFTAVPILVYSFCPTSVSILCRTCVYTHTHIWHRTDCVWITVKHFYTYRSSAKCWLDIIIGEPVWRWLGQYGTLDRTFYSLLLNRKQQQQPSDCHILLLTAFLDEAFITDIIQ